MLIGLLCVLGACLMWGTIFILPLLLADYPGIVLSFGRYLAFGLIALIPAWFDRRELLAMSKADWMVALKLSLIGNILYYATLATAIQLAGAPLPAMLIGTLPVVIAVCSNWAPAERSEKVPWLRLLPSLIIILAGLMLVNGSELQHFDNTRSLPDYLLGFLFAVGAVACWTWYPMMNARHLKARMQLRSSTWATAQGLATLPLALAGFLGYGMYAGIADSAYPFPFGPQPLLFIGLMLATGLGASWLGTLLWNRASQRLPTALMGQLIIFETLAALAYAFILRGALPAPQVLVGVILLCAGVMLGVRLFRRI